MKILIADDHELIRQGLRQTLQSGALDAEVLEARSAQETLAVIASNQDLDLVLRLRNRTRLRLLTPAVESSGRRWLEKGYFSTTLSNWRVLAHHLAERAFTSCWPERGNMPGE